MGKKDPRVEALHRRRAEAQLAADSVGLTGSTLRES